MRFLCKIVIKNALFAALTLIVVFGLGPLATLQASEGSLLKIPDETVRSAVTTFEVRNLEAALDTLKPPFNALRLADTPEAISASAKPLSEDTKLMFSKLKLLFFGLENVLSLSTCSSCDLQIDISAMVVYADPDYIAEFAKRGNLNLQFILAHEIAHYAYEYLVAASPSKLSPNGQKSLLNDPDLIFSLEKMNKSWEKSVLALLKKGSPRHAEVDALAITALWRNGVDVRSVPSVLASLMKDPSNQGLDNFDARVRVASAERYCASLLRK